MHCDNCGAEMPEGRGGRDSLGRWICCIHCVFNPLGCRCKYEDYGQPQTPEVMALAEPGELP